MSNELLLEKLEDDLIDKLDQFPGVAGVSIKDLISGNDISINGNEIFPTASIIKIHILLIHQVVSDQTMLILVA